MMAYNRVNWVDGSGGNTPINAGNLNVMDRKIYELDQMVEQLNAPASTNKKGLVRPDGTTIKVSADGTITSASEVKQEQINAINNRIDNLVLHSGDSNPEVVDARVTPDGKVYPTLKDRLDADNETLSDNADYLKGDNLFNKYGATLNAMLDTTNGSVASSTSTWITGFIPVKANTDYYIPQTGTSRRWFYNSSKAPTDYLNSSLAQVYRPTQDGYLNITVSNTVDINTFQINEGTEALSYNAYREDNVELTAKLSQLESTDSVKFTKIPNSYVDYPNGTITSYNTWARTEYIDLLGLNTLIINISGVMSGAGKYNFFYDENKNAVSSFEVGDGENIIPIPKNARYCILSFYNPAFDTLSIKANGVRGVNKVTEDLSDYLTPTSDGQGYVFDTIISSKVGTGTNNTYYGFFHIPQYLFKNLKNRTIEVSSIKTIGGSTEAKEKCTVSFSTGAFQIGTTSEDLSGRPIEVRFKLK